MGKHVRVVAAVFFFVTVGVLCATCSPSSTTPTSVNLAVTGTVPAVGQTSQLIATATLSSGTMQDVTTQAAWSSSNSTIATVSGSGLLKVLALGVATITATYQGASGTLSVSTSLTSLTVTGPTTLTIGQQYRFSATANFSNGTTQDVTTQTTWTTNGGAFLLLSPQGLVTPLAVSSGLPPPGLIVSAYYQGLSAQSASLSIVAP